MAVIDQPLEERTQPALRPPIAMLAELTHRCPLQCPYCSNPLDLQRRSEELTTEEWCDVIRQAAARGVMQIHLSGGEPTARPDLAEIVAAAQAAGLYSNLITSGVLLDEARLATLKGAGLDHVQISFQDTRATGGDLIGNFKGGHEKKLAVSKLVRAAGLPLTVNVVVHRQNLDRLSEMIDLAVALDAARLEIAHVQYYGWALKNRAAFIPTLAQIERATEIVDAARERLTGVLVIDYVVPDYYARRPKACMGGWGRRFLNVSPAGKVLPCHAAESIPELDFESVRDRPLDEIWRESAAFQRFRGTGWMPEPCRSCDQREIDWGGCRCQALALTGSAGNTDPACDKSPLHTQIFELARSESASTAPAFIYRRYGNA